MSQKDTLVGYYQWGEKVKPYRGLSVTTPPDSILAQDSDSWMYKGQWRRVWSNRLFTDVNVGLFGFGWPMAPNVDFETNPPRTDLGNGFNSGAGWLAGDAGGPFTFDRNKPQITVTSSYYLPEKAGSHDLKVGFEWMDDQSKFGNNGNSGPILYRDRNGGTAEIEFFDFNSFETFGTGWTGPDDRNKRLAIFVQDRWALTDRLTLTLGLRYDRQQPVLSVSGPRSRADGNLRTAHHRGNGAAHEQQDRAAPRRRLRSRRQRQVGDQGVLRAVLLQFRGSAQQPESGRHQQRALDVYRPERKSAVRRPPRARHADSDYGGHDDETRSRHEDPVYRRVQRLLRAAVLGRIELPCGVRSQTGARRIRHARPGP